MIMKNSFLVFSSFYIIVLYQIIRALKCWHCLGLGSFPLQKYFYRWAYTGYFYRGKYLLTMVCTTTTVTYVFWEESMIQE